MYDVVVIGAGISGLYVTWQLEKRGLKVLLLEKKDRIGGRLKTVSRNGKVFDVGGIRYSLTHHKRLVKLFKDLSIHNTEHKIYPHTYKSTNDTVFLKKVFKLISDTFDADELKGNTIEYFLRKLDLNNPGLADRFINSWGYLGNIQNAQAYWFLKSTSNMYNGSRMYYMKSGFKGLINRLRDAIQSEPRKECGVHKIEIDQNEIIKIHTKDDIIHSKQVVCALPPDALFEIDFFDKYKTLLYSVTSNNYIRVFSEIETRQKFSSHHGNELVPQTISRGDGIVQLAYADAKRAEHLRNAYLNGRFPTNEVLEKFKFTKVKWIESFYWKNGTHYWNPYVDVESVYKRIMNPEKNVFIVGEAFSKKQAWIEGALESVDDLLGLMFKKSFQLEKRRFASSESDNWIIYRNVKYDITEYEKNHPGGIVIHVGKGNDITDIFDNVPHSEFARNMLMNLPVIEYLST